MHRGFSRILRFATAILAIGLVVAPAATGCGGGSQTTKKSKTAESKRKARTSLSQAREAARAGNYEKASSSYRAAFEATGDKDIFTEHVEVLIEAKEYDLADQILSTLLQANPDDKLAIALLADTYLAQDKAKATLKLADKLVELDEDDAAGYQKRGRALLLQGKFDEAIEALRIAVSKDGDNVTGLLALGDAHWKAGNTNDAALQYRAAYQKAPEDPKVLVALATAVREQRGYDEAKTYLEKAISLNDELAVAHFELGLLLDRMSDSAGAEARIAKAVELAPKESRYWYGFGEILRLQNKVEEAKDSYRKAINLATPHPKAAAKLAAILLEEKDYEGAERILTVAMRKDNRNSLNYLVLGNLYVSRKKNTQAVEMYQRFLELAAPTDPERKRVKDLVSELKRR